MKGTSGRKTVRKPPLHVKFKIVLAGTSNCEMGQIFNRNSGGDGNLDVKDLPCEGGRVLPQGRIF